MTGHSETEKARILIVDDEPINLRLLNSLLKDDYKIMVATAGEQAIQATQKLKPDLILLDIMMPGMNGYEVCRQLKADPLTAHIPVMFITAMSEAEDETRCFELGAVDFISKPFNNSVVQARVRTHIELKLKSDLLAMMVAQDGLTGIPNRRAYDDGCEREWGRAIRLGAPFSLVMMDVDMFKQFNDHYGHAQGDECLKRVAQAVYGCGRRPTDIVARYGGEEFSAVLPDTDLEGARVVAEMMLSSVRQLNIPHALSKVCEFVTISIGVASVNPATSEVSLKQLAEEADRMLYLAKASGRNQVQISQL